MTSLDPIAFHTALDSIFGFVGYDGPLKSGFTRKDDVLPDELAAAHHHFYAAGWSYRSAAAVNAPSHGCSEINNQQSSILNPQSSIRVFPPTP